MKLNLSEQERGTLFAVLNDIPWGGSELALLARDELYDALALSEFERKYDILKLSRTARKEELSRYALEHLISTLTSANLTRLSGRILAPVVRRARAVLDANQPKKAAGAAT